MKKAKVILTALVIVSAVGGALAFKAKKAQNIWCGTKNAVAGTSLCPIYLQTDYTSTAASNTYCTKQLGQNCVDPTIVTIFNP